MANIEGIITQDIRKTIAPGQKVYDIDGKQSGSVDMVDHENGYFTVEKNPFSDKDLYVPFRLITNIDPRELFVSVTRDDLETTCIVPMATRRPALHSSAR